jgi:catechol 2,3-dioxygenase-like lactoylglutathione lyase family enzyme
LKVKRIVADIAVPDSAPAKRFYRDILGLDVLMDMGWIATYGSHEKMAVEVSVMTEGGSGAPVPDLSIEVDDLDTALTRIDKAKIPIEYGPTSEPWGVRRFFVRDPVGKLVNILAHERTSEDRLPVTPNPRLATIAGRWRTTGHVIGEPPIPIRGTDIYEVLAGGHFLVHHIDVMVGDQPVRAIEIIGERDGEGFLARSFNRDGRVEMMRLTIDADGVFHFSDGGDVAPASKPSDVATVRVRSTLTVGAERKTMSARWERSEDGTTWLPWMDVRFVSIDS